MGAFLTSCMFSGKTIESNKEVDPKKDEPAKTFELNKEFNLKKNETAQISETELKIKMLGAGHDISESGETPYCKIEVSYKGKTSEREVSIRDEAGFGDLLIDVTKVDEQGGAKGSDPFANTNCSFLVKRK